MRVFDRRWFAVAVLAWGGLYLFPVAACAATFHVSPSGSNTSPYDTYAKAAHQVADAVLAASGYGDTVLIHPGDYDIDTTISLPKGVSLQGADRDSTELAWRGPYQPAGANMVWLNGDHEISHIGFINPEGASYQRVIALGSSSVPGSFSVHHCRFRQTEIFASCWVAFEISQDYFEVGGGLGITTAAGGMVDCHDNTFFGGPGFENPTCVMAFGSQILLRDNVFDLKANAARGYGYAVDAQYSSGGPLTVRNNLILGGREAINWWYHEGSIENNTIIGASHGFGAAILESFQTLTIRNNAIVNCGGVPGFGVCTSCGPGAHIELTHNAFWPPVDTFHTTEEPSYYVTVVDSANFNAYPMFVDDSLFHLQRGSPLIDRGAPSLLDPDGTRSDIGWTGGPGGQSFPYPELPPEPPDSAWESTADHVVTINWIARPEADLAGYRLYRGESSGFWMPGLSPVRQFAATETLGVDTMPPGWVNAYYVVTAFDTTGLESGPSREVAVVPTDTGGEDTTVVFLPRTPRIARAYPNPFNASTVIQVEIPAIGASPASVEIAVFDAGGHRVATIFKGGLEPGSHAIAWDAARTGAHLASGVYFARLKVWSQYFGPPVKLVLIK